MMSSDNYSEGKYQESLGLGEVGTRLHPQRTIKSVRLQKTNYMITFEDDTTMLAPRLTSVLGILSKPALIYWSGAVEREVCFEAANEAVSQTIPLDFRERFDAALVKRLGRSKNGNIKYANQVKKEAGGDIGSQTHALIQNHLRQRLGKDEPLPEASEPAQWAFMAWEEWAARVDFTPTNAETPLGSERLGVGGTNDAAGWLNLDTFLIETGTIPHDAELTPGMMLLPIKEGGVQKLPPRFAVWDWKSSKRSKSQPDGIYYESLVQVSVYRRMGIDMGLFPEDSIAGVVRLPKDPEDPVFKEKLPVDVRVLEPEEADDYVKDFETFRAAWARLAMRGQA